MPETSCLNAYLNDHDSVRGLDYDNVIDAGSKECAIGSAPDDLGVAGSAFRKSE